VRHGVKIYIHPTCKSSYTLIKHLYEKQLLPETQLIDATRLPVKAPWSVPWIEANGYPAATDPVSPEEVDALILDGRIEPPSRPVEAFMESILYSGHASAQVLLHQSLTPVIDEDYIMAALRAPGDRETVEAAAREIESRREELYWEWKGRIARALSLSFARELAWALGGRVTPETLEDRADPLTISLWITAKASTGRAGLPWRPSPPPAAEEMSGFLRRGAKRIARKVNEEIAAINGDSVYWDIVASTLSGGGS